MVGSLRHRSRRRPRRPASGVYRHGLSRSGAPIEALAQGDVRVGGDQLSCAQCHRESGYGSSEGGVYVPAITGPILYRAREHDRAAVFKQLFKESQPPRFSSRVRSPRTRPAYTDESLARAIRDGTDSSGRVLDELMPRYDLDPRDMADLIEYLQTLSTEQDPGVDPETIYLATVVTDGVAPTARKALLETMRGFVEWMNLDTAGDTRNPEFSPSYRSDLIGSYRLWHLDVWELRGPPDTWTAQAEAHYESRPVFALVGGVVAGPWQPVHEVCERRRMPCLFPQTVLPVVEGPNRSTLFFHRGMTLEAEVLASHLESSISGADRGSLLQIHDDQPEGSVPAAVLRQELGVETIGVGSSAALLGALEQSSHEVVVLWPGRFAAQALDWIGGHPRAARRYFLPSTSLALLGAAGAPSEQLRERLRFVYPYEVPGAYHPRAFRVRAWLGTRGIDIVDTRLQYDTYFALTTLQYGLEHIAEDLSRTYLLETIEHEAENALNPGTYPRLSLGPGQRFASRGAYIVQLGSADEAQIVAESPWIVP